MGSQGLTQAQRLAVLEVLRGNATQEEICTRERVEAATYRSWEQVLISGKLTTGDGELCHASLRQGASIRRDRWGVAHCSGEELEDLFFAAGVAQAQDRLWQLDYRRRLAQGRLSAILGPDYLRQDREHRTIGFHRIVEAQELPFLAPEATAALGAFAAGVNAWVDVVSDNWPLEFEVLQYEPEPWQVTDSLAILRYFWWTLTGRLSQLVAAERLLRGTSPEVARWFMTPETISTIVPGEGDQTALWDQGLWVGDGAAADDPARIPGSNNWVAARQRLASGGPVLAADPHWPLAFPDMWYEQHLCGAGFDVIGPAYPGAPPVIFGRTRGIAWGRTNNVSSTRDLYHHEVDPDDADVYRAGTGWSRFAKVRESIDVAGAPSVDHEIRLTAEGQPIVNELIASVAPEGDGPISLRWVGQERIGDVQVLLDIGRSQTVDETLSVFGDWRLSVWNSVVADSAGHVAYQMCGSVPRRPVPTRGTRPAADERHEWNGYWNTPELPGELDPDRGWVASANNPPILPGTQPPLYGSYADGYRYERIARYLNDTDLTSEQIGALQADNLSLRGEDLSAAVAAQLQEVDVPRAGDMATQLRSWNHRFDADQTGASIWSVLWPRLVDLMGRHVLPPFVAELNAANAGRLTRALLLGIETGLPGIDLRPLVAEAATSAVTYLRPVLGEEIDTWTWGRLQSMKMHHPLSTNEAARRVFDPPPIPCDGGNGVVNNRAARETDTGLEVVGGPSYRLVVDLSTSHAMGCLLAGQSGQPGHPHYADQLKLWPAGQWHPLYLDAEAIDEAAVSQFRLRPA